MVTNSETLNRRLARLRLLEPNWDDEGADPPNEQAIAAATFEVQRLLATGASPDDIEIDADVMGGVAVYVYAGEFTTWIACMNSGARTEILRREPGR